ncbi:hypothetical protein BJ165DRAFT_1526383 [Panaeolus papilionaceus]|nr:hypothetical protein BJ165DRAFT_1526383 [Panaeolus papilionaceus]
MQPDNTPNLVPPASLNDTLTPQDNTTTNNLPENPSNADPNINQTTEPPPPQPTTKLINTGAHRTISANHQTSKERSQPYPVPNKGDQNPDDNHPALPPSKQMKKRDHNKTARRTSSRNTPDPTHTDSDSQPQYNPNDLPMADPEPAEERFVPNSGGYTLEEHYQPGADFERYPNEKNWPSSGEESNPEHRNHPPVPLPPYTSSFRFKSPRTPQRNPHRADKQADSTQEGMSISPTPTRKGVRATHTPGVIPNVAQGSRSNATIVEPTDKSTTEPKGKPTNTSRFPTLKPYIENTTSRSQATTLNPFLELPNIIPTVHLDNQFMYMAVHEQSLEEWRNTTGPGVLALLYRAKPQKNGYNMTRAIQDTLALDLLGEDVKASPCQPEPVARNEDLLLQIHLRATTSHAIFYYPVKLPISKHILCIQHYNANPDEKGCIKVADMVKYSICKKKGNPEKFIATIKNMNPEHLTPEATAKHDLIDRCTMVVDSIQVKGFMLGGQEDQDKNTSFHNNRSGRPIFTVYIDSPTTDHDDHDKLVELLRSIHYGDITSNAEVVTAFNCSGCKGTDHVTVHCPFRNILGWPSHSLEKSHPAPSNKPLHHPSNHFLHETPTPQSSSLHQTQPPASPCNAAFEKAYSIYAQRGKGLKGKGRANFNA